MEKLDKINKATLSFKENNKEAKLKENEYTKMVYEFFDNLSEEKIVQFDKIIDLLGDMQKDDLIVAYNTGVDSVSDKSDFSIPHYIFEEFIRYYNKNKSTIVWDNLTSLLNLAKINGRLTQDQVDYLKNEYK